MENINLQLPDIPHGHGASFIRGIVDGLLKTEERKNDCHNTHFASYRHGKEVGNKIKDDVMKHVTPSPKV